MKAPVNYENSLFNAPLATQTRHRASGALISLYATHWEVIVYRTGFPSFSTMYMHASLASIMRLARAVKARDGRGL